MKEGKQVECLFGHHTFDESIELTPSKNIQVALANRAPTKVKICTSCRQVAQLRIPLLTNMRETKIVEETNDQIKVYFEIFDCYLRLNLRDGTVSLAGWFVNQRCEATTQKGQACQAVVSYPGDKCRWHK